MYLKFCKEKHQLRKNLSTISGKININSDLKANLFKYWVLNISMLSVFFRQLPHEILEFFGTLRKTIKVSRILSSFNFLHEKI